MTAQKEILNDLQFNAVLRRLALAIIENHVTDEQVAMVGLQPRGVALANRLMMLINELTAGDHTFLLGKLDITFYRDDVRSARQVLLPTETQIDFSVENKTVILIDDVLHTGRTIRSAMDALLDFGRPQKVELLCLIDRVYSRELPVQPDYTGLMVDTVYRQRVQVKWKENDEQDAVVLIG